MTAHCAPVRAGGTTGRQLLAQALKSAAHQVHDSSRHSSNEWTRYWEQAGFTPSSLKALAWTGVGRVVMMILASELRLVEVML